MDVIFHDAVESDKTQLISLLEVLQDHMVTLDPIKRVRRLPEYGAATYKELTAYVAQYQGKCICAEVDGEVVGFISGLISEQSAENLLVVIPNKLGVIKELFVKEKFRKQRIGKQLITRMEEYFKQSGCDGIWIEVFAPNEKALEFYNQIGFQDRDIGMLKKLD